MKFDVKFVRSADDDLNYYKIREQRILLDAIGIFLETDADVASKRQKQLRPNPLAPWELRVGDYRVFYEIVAQSSVRVLAIGHKAHNVVFIRGERVEL